MRAYVIKEFAGGHIVGIVSSKKLAIQSAENYVNEQPDTSLQLVWEKSEKTHGIVSRGYRQAEYLRYNINDGLTED